MRLVILSILFVIGCSSSSIFATATDVITSLDKHKAVECTEAYHEMLGADSGTSCQIDSHKYVEFDEDAKTACDSNEFCTVGIVHESMTSRFVGNVLVLVLDNGGVSLADAIVSDIMDSESNPQSSILKRHL